MVRSVEGRRQLDGAGAGGETKAGRVGKGSRVGGAVIDEQPEELWRAVSAYSCTGATAQKRPAPAQPLQYGHHMRGGRTGPITKAAITDTVGNGYRTYAKMGKIMHSCTGTQDRRAAFNHLI